MKDDTPKTHWKQLVPQRFFGAYALPNGNDLTVTIDYVTNDTVTLEGGKKESKMMMFIVGHLPLILNSTNAKALTKLFGTPDHNKWAGQQVTLYAGETKLGRELVECVRVREKVAIPKKEALEDARLAKAIVKILAGEYTVEELRGRFVLTRAQEDAIRAAIEGSGQ